MDRVAQSGRQAGKPVVHRECTAYSVRDSAYLLAVRCAGRRASQRPRLSGSFDIVLNDGTETRRYHMARSYYGLYVPRMMWRELDNFSTNSLALVLSSTLYDAGDYIEDFEEYRTLLKGRNDE